MTFKFEKLEVWQLAVDYVDAIYVLIQSLPRQEEYNLSSQLRRAAISIALNIAEGSTGQTNAEQARFLGLAIRSLIETVASLRLIARRQYLNDQILLQNISSQAETLAPKLQAFRQAIAPEQNWLREPEPEYVVSGE